jgi:hypothetical protein
MPWLFTVEKTPGAPVFPFDKQHKLENVAPVAAEIPGFGGTRNLS